MGIRETLGENLRRLREVRGFSQEDAAHEADITLGHWSKIERGKVSAGLDVLARMAAALGVDAGELLRQVKKGR